MVEIFFFILLLFYLVILENDFKYKISIISFFFVFKMKNFYFLKEIDEKLTKTVNNFR